MIGRLPLLGTAVLLALGLVACGTTASGGSGVPAETPSAAAPTPLPSRTPRTLPTATPAPTPAECPAATDENSVCQIVSAFANIFGAGGSYGPAPGGGGGGELPPELPLPTEATRIVTFPTVTGEIFGRIGQAPPNGPGGETLLGTDVASFRGISGIVHRDKAMFLVGVFLTDDQPADPAPARLEYTDENEDFDLLEPEIGQTFLIGDGIGRQYLAPPGATRLFLGFVEGMFYEGRPGWYGNNSGQLAVTVSFGEE